MSRIAVRTGCLVTKLFTESLQNAYVDDVFNWHS